MKAIIKYTYQPAAQSYYDNSGRLITPASGSCNASAEVKNDRAIGQGTLFFSGRGDTYEEAKNKALEAAKAYFAHRDAPEPEIVEV